MCVFVRVYRRRHDMPARVPLTSSRAGRVSVTSRRAGPCVRDQPSSRVRDAATKDLCPENETFTTVAASYCDKINVVVILSHHVIHLYK